MKYYLYILIICVPFLSGCSDFLKEHSQDTYYVKSWKDLNEVLIGSCYMPIKLSEWVYNTPDNQYFIHFLGDELCECVDGADMNSTEQPNSKERVFGYYTWQQRSGTNETYTGYNIENENWVEIYKLINVANNIIYSDKKVPHSTQEDKIGTLKVDGEAHFLRAYYYFWLVNLYGKPYNPSTAKTDLGVPIKLSENVEDKYFDRNTVQEVYDQILIDLNQAESDLSQTGSPISVYRASVTAVRFLLSRVYLYMQNWDKAAEYAQKVIDANPQIMPLNNLAVGSGFLSKSSIETIFSMGGNSLPCVTTFRYKGFQVSDSLYNSYDDNDLRKIAFWWHYNNYIGYTKLASVSSSTASSNKYYGWYDYNAPYNGEKTEISDKFLFRSPEAYLTKAEADAYLGKEDEARSALNILRGARYKSGSDYLVTATGQDLVEIIRDERRKELALEGQRWFDLRRYAVCEKYPESKQIVHKYYYYESFNSIVKTEYHTFILKPYDAAYVLPIPQEVIDFNVGMENNILPIRTYTVTKLNN
ncbi:MAG: RagB/SusD family nutrient uptake outer membrane protein [Bacteroidales bacterium]|nr:RagB/SusD family nutrient uptake outer membrane protein [Bacteroidales bacterium]